MTSNTHSMLPLPRSKLVYKNESSSMASGDLAKHNSAASMPHFADKGKLDRDVLLDCSQ